jgi:peroxiredoxin Q/BCP
VSPDPVDSHAKFAKKLKLNYPLLADPDRALIDALGLWVEKSLYGKKYFGVERSTFLIDENGKILKIWRKVKPEGHAQEVLEVIRTH